MFQPVSLEMWSLKDSFVASDSVWRYLSQSHHIPWSDFSDTHKLPYSHKRQGIRMQTVAGAQKGAQLLWLIWRWATMDFLQSCWECGGQARVYAPAVQCEQWHKKAAGLLPTGPTKAARSSPCNANTLTVAAGEACLCSHLLLSPAHPPQFWYWEGIRTEREATMSADCKGIRGGRLPSELKAYTCVTLGWGS